jgi:DNA repair exonuclease SbcCD ATPase subunit
MRLQRLYLENFQCHEKSFIDLREISSALIVGKVDNNDLVSNGVGKTSIFQAIEYVLFNKSDAPLERIVRDDTNSCKITVDFIVDDNEYRLVRVRTRKGSTDLSLFQRNSVVADEEKAYNTIEGVPVTDEKYWKDLSGRRTSDTEKDLNKLIKINFEAFRNTIHFVQGDFAGLTTSTPEKRKGILKDALNLLVYTKLEKMAKDKANAMSKEIDKLKSLIQVLGDPEQDLIDQNRQISDVTTQIFDKTVKLNELTEQLEELNVNINTLTNSLSNLESKFSSLLIKDQALSSEKNRLEISIKEYHSKKGNIAKGARDLVDEINVLKEQQVQLAQLDYSQIDILTELVSSKKEKIAVANANIKSNLLAYEELNIPLPDDSSCKHCRQPLTPEHKKFCQAQIDQQRQECQTNIQNSKREVASLNTEILSHQQIINELNLSKQKLEGINTKISTKNKEILDKKSIHQEYIELLGKFTNELQDKTKEVEEVKESLLNSPLEESKAIKLQIEEEKKKLTQLNSNILLMNKEITHLTSNKAVVSHTIEQRIKDRDRKQDLLKSLKDLESKLTIFPSVIQAFSSTGIPNLIIQNVLDDLQVEANNLLAQIKPGLQLSFFVEKTKGDGTEADTLDINYHINGKDRYYKQLSGGMKLAVTFSLKLGLSFLLQKMIGTDIKFLLLDEIDASLDKVSVDAFADIVKFLQKDFTVLVITHNDRLKDKFSHAILVEQDTSMVSKASVVSFW